MAGLGDLPDTLMSRSIIIRMRRRAPDEKVTPFRRRLAEPDGIALRDGLAEWTASISNQLANAWPEMPEGVVDRPADVWEALLAIADAAGGSWPERAREACTDLCKVSNSREASLGVRLLTDLRGIFGDDDRLGTETILERLHDLDEAPWANLRGVPLDARGLAYRLSGYEISSTKVKVGGASVRGYRRIDLWDAWQRYCPETPREAEPPEPTELPLSQQASEVPPLPTGSGTEEAAA